MVLPKLEQEVAIIDTHVSPDQAATIIDKVSAIKELEWRFPGAVGITGDEMRGFIEERAGLQPGQIREVNSQLLQLHTHAPFIAVYPGVSGAEHIKREFGYGYAHLVGYPLYQCELVELARTSLTTFPVQYQLRVVAHSEFARSDDWSWFGKERKKWIPKSAEAERKLAEVLSDFK